MHSRARFSFGCPRRFPNPSSHSRSAGSRSIARAMVGKGPNADARRVSFCCSMRPASRTFTFEVAQWPCQNQVRRSSSGCALVVMRSSHHTMRADCWAARTGVPASPGTVTGGSAGGGTSVPVAPAAVAPAMMRARVAATPASSAAGYSSGAGPKDSRCNSRAARTRSAASAPCGATPTRPAIAMTPPSGRDASGCVCEQDQGCVNSGDSQCFQGESAPEGRMHRSDDVALGAQRPLREALDAQWPHIDDGALPEDKVAQHLAHGRPLQEPVPREARGVQEARDPGPLPQ